MCSTVRHNFCRAELLNIHPNILKHQYSYSYFIFLPTKKGNQSRVLQQKNATRHTTYLLSPQKKVLPFFHLNFSVPKKTTFPTFIRWAPRANVAPEPTCPKWRWKPQGLRFDWCGWFPDWVNLKKNWETNQGFKTFENIVSKKIEDEDVSCFFHPSVCDVSRLFGKKTI